MDEPLIQNPQVQRLRVPPIATDPILYKGKAKWVFSWSPKISDVIYGRVILATHYTNTTPMLYLKYWTFQNVTSTSRTHTSKDLYLHF